MQSLRVSHLCHATSPYGKPSPLPRGTVHGAFAAAPGRHRSVEWKWNAKSEVEMENLNANADAAKTPQGAVRRPLAMLRTWHRRARARRCLSTLDDRILADIGVSRADVNKCFWQA